MQLLEHLVLVTLAVTCLCLAVWSLRTARALRATRRAHAAHTSRLAWAEWWGKNALEYRDGHPTRAALHTFALLALRAPSLQFVIRELQRLARPEKELGVSDEKGPSGARVWWALAESRARDRGDAEALELVNRAGEALDEIRRGSPLFDTQAGEIRWLMPQPYADGQQGGAWAVPLIEKETRADVSKAREFAFERIRELLQLETIG